MQQLGEYNRGRTGDDFTYINLLGTKLDDQGRFNREGNIFPGRETQNISFGNVIVGQNKEIGNRPGGGFIETFLDDFQADRSVFDADRITGTNEETGNVDAGTVDENVPMRNPLPGLAA